VTVTTPAQAGSRARRPDVSEQIAAATRSVPGVAGLHGGTFGEIATYLPARRVIGVRVGPDRVEIHLTVAWDAPVGATAAAVRAAVRALVDQPVDVTVEDIVLPSIT
jgi:uncharacterized alkaline shock family protein YloU